jgi:hypothetical protein
MENMSELQRQARVFLANNPRFLPLPYVEDVLFHGGVDRYVVAGGIDINTPEGSHILNKEAALYITCLELCNMGVGNRPYQPHPYLHDPVIVEPEQGGPVGPGQDQPAAGEPAPVNPGHQGVRIVRVEGQLFPPPPPLRPAPPAYHAQPLHWVFREPPKPKAEPKVKPEPGPGEYIEPVEEKPGTSK